MLFQVAPSAHVARAHSHPPTHFACPYPVTGIPWLLAGKGFWGVDAVTYSRGSVERPQADQSNRWSLIGKRQAERSCQLHVTLCG